MNHTRLTDKVLRCCADVMREIGSGLSEVVYKRALSLAFAEQKIENRNNISCQIKFRSENIGCCNMDFLVENELIIEVKSVDSIFRENSTNLFYLLKSTGVFSAMQVNFGRPEVEFRMIRNEKDIYGSYNR